MPSEIIAVAFGEIDISKGTIYLIVFLTVFMFSAVGISTLRLFSFSDTDSENEKNNDN